MKWAGDKASPTRSGYAGGGALAVWNSPHCFDRSIDLAPAPHSHARREMLPLERKGLWLVQRTAVTVWTYHTLHRVASTFIDKPYLELINADQGKVLNNNQSVEADW